MAVAERNSSSSSTDQSRRTGRARIPGKGVLEKLPQEGEEGQRSNNSYFEGHYSHHDIEVTMMAVVVEGEMAAP